MKTIAKITAASLACAVMATPALATENSAYGETRINELPTRGVLAHKPWVGSWWAYTKNGVAYRHKTSSFPECSGVSAGTSPQELIDDDKAFCLSAAEKVDYLKGRIGDIEWDKIKQYQELAQGDLHGKQTESRTLVRKLNAWLADNPNGNWRETEDGIAYIALREEIETLEAALPEIDIDTATEFEHISHGRGVPGVEGWWGHCNAWAGAALMEDEPKVRGEVSIDGKTVEFTPGEAKALITEAWMEHRSSFHGSRHNEPENDKDEVTFADITPAGFVVYFGTQLGKLKKGFVLDRFTGSEVWNQTARSYVWELEPLYENDEAESVELKQTDYDFRGNGKIRELGARDVYPVQVEATVHWMTDGLPHEAETVDNILAQEWPTSHSALRALWGNQVEMRHITATIYLDKPLSDPAAKIVGDGVWNHEGMGQANHLHPDFVWQPLSQTPSQRDYENPHIDYEGLVVPHILTATAEQDDGGDNGGGDPGGAAGSGTFDASPHKAIPDNDRGGVSDSIEVTGTGAIETAVVAVDIEHTYIGDLLVFVEKDGQRHVLHERAGGSRDNLKKRFDLPQLQGASGNGTWALTIIDNARIDTGKLKAWSVELTWGGGDVVDPGDGGDNGGPEDLTFEDAPGTDIPDNAPAGVSTSINVAQGGVINTASVTVNITHTYKGDLLVVLEKDGQTYTLHNRAGRGDDDINETFEISALAGKQLRGAWKLKVSDHANRDVGTIDSWSINVNADVTDADRDENVDPSDLTEEG